jgi:hypothetical protein
MAINDANAIASSGKDSLTCACCRNDVIWKLRCNECKGSGMVQPCRVCKSTGATGQLPHLEVCVTCKGRGWLAMPKPKAIRNSDAEYYRVG